MVDVLTAFVIIGGVLMIAALVSGLVERSVVSFPMIFLGLGLLVGQGGLGWLKITPRSEDLQVVSTLSLAFVLFLDAINLRFNDMGKTWMVPILTLGPGTLLTIVLTAGAAMVLLKLALLPALMLGTVLASVDPILLRDVSRDERIPRSVRQSLITEAGTNDLIVLPVLLILVALSLGQLNSAGGTALFLVKMFLLGPGIGLVVGLIALKLMEVARNRTSIGREYRALYGVGTILVAYFAGEAVGASGFLAVFTAGLVAAIFDYDLCDCFLEYGETTSEMAMLLAFLLFGAMLSGVLGGIALLPALGLAAFLLLVARPLAINLLLVKAPISRRARAFIGWFGPRGLSALLYGLLIVIQKAPGAEQLLAVSGVVVIVSVLAHGLSAGPLAEQYERAVRREVLPEEREGTAAGLLGGKSEGVPRITPDELAARLGSDDPPVVLDVRARSEYERSDLQIPGSVRVTPDRVAEWAEGQPRERSIVAYCT